MNDNMQNMQYGAYNQNWQQPTIKPSGFWYVIAAAFLIGGIIIAVILFASMGRNLFAFIESMHEFQGPGKVEAHFDKAGKYYIYSLSQRTIPTNPEQTQKFNVVVDGTNQQLPLIPVSNEALQGDINFNNQDFSPLYSFMLFEPATVLVTALPIKGNNFVGRYAVGPAIDPKDIMAIGFQVLGGVGALVGGFVLALITFLITIIKRSNCHKRIAQMAQAAQMQQMGQQSQYAQPGQQPPPQNYPPSQPMA